MQCALLDWTIRQLVSLSTVFAILDLDKNSTYHWWELEWTMDIMFKSKYVCWVATMSVDLGLPGPGLHGAHRVSKSHGGLQRESGCHLSLDSWPDSLQKGMWDVQAIYEHTQ